MAKTAFNRFIADAKRNGLPTGFLHEVAHSSYEFRVGGDTHVNPWINVMTLEQKELDSVAGLSPSGPLKLSQGVLNIYHEATHAWLDLNEGEPEVAALVKHGDDYYKAAPLVGGAKARDPSRIFQEAMASYVGHRVARLWLAIQTFTHLVTGADEKNLKRNVDGLARAARTVRSDFERAMGERVFGYQTASWFNDSQQETVKMIWVWLFSVA